MNSFIIPSFTLSDKDFFVSNISVSIDIFEITFNEYNYTQNKFHETWMFDYCKHDNYAEFYIVHKLSKLQLDLNDFAKQYADHYFNLFLGLTTDSVKSSKCVGIFYGLEYANGIEIWKKLNNHVKSDLIEIKNNYEFGIDLLIQNSVLLINIDLDQIDELNKLAESFRMYWSLWKKTPTEYDFFVNVEYKN